MRKIDAGTFAYGRMSVQVTETESNPSLRLKILIAGFEMSEMEVANCLLPVSQPVDKSRCHWFPLDPYFGATFLVWILDFVIHLRAEKPCQSYEDTWRAAL